MQRVVANEQRLFLIFGIHFHISDNIKKKILFQFYVSTVRLPRLPGLPNAST